MTSSPDDNHETATRNSPVDPLEVDYSDMVVPYSELGDTQRSTELFQRVERGSRKLNFLTIANANATAFLYAIFLLAHLFFMANGEWLVLGLLGVGFGALKIAGAAFLYRYWKLIALDRDRDNPLKIALVSLAPIFDLWWFRMAYKRGADRGMETIQRIDGNRMGYRNPSLLASGAFIASFVAYAVYAFVAIYFIVEDINVEDLSYAFSVAILLMGTFSRFAEVIWLLVLGLVALMTALALRLALVLQMGKMANYVNDVRLYSDEDSD
ncbi:MAG: hypothetical protein ACOX0A_07900 [Thermoguttaceae bacterium]|jgi:hypothetical protein